jgi:iron complex outermembrane receptor protein
VAKNNRSRIVAVSLVGFAMLVSLPGLVLAADTSAAGSSSDTLQEIVVTANKLNAQSVLDIPASVQALSGDALQQQGASGIMSIAGQVPGLSIQDLGPGDKKYVIRGINSTGASTTGVYFGEAVISSINGDDAGDGGGMQADIRLYDMDRVEVLRGPQGTLYGASSMSGTIRFIPKEPDMNTVGGYLTTEGSDTEHASGNYNVNGALNLPIVDGVLSLRMVGWKLYNSGYIDQLRVGEGVTANNSAGVPEPVQSLGFRSNANDDAVGGGRAILRYQPNDNLTIDLNYLSQTEDSNGSSRYTPAGVTAFSGGTIAPIQGCDLCNTDVTQSPWTDNIKLFGFTATYKISGVGLLTATSNQLNRQTEFNFDSTPILLSFGLPAARQPAETMEPRERQLNSSEIRFASDFQFPVNFVAGVFRQFDERDLAVHVITTNGYGLPNGPFSSSNAADAFNFPGVGDTFFGSLDHRDDTQYAGFGEATWKITDAWTAVAGVRYFTESLTGYQTQTHPFGGFPGSPNLVPIPDPNETFHKVTYKGNLSYQFSDALLSYATVATGFRSGGLNPQNEPFEPIPGAYAPDTLTNYEVGVKGRLAHGLFDYQVDVYLIDWSNIQEQETTADGAFTYLGNAGHARVKGVEFELNVRPIEYLTVSLSGSYQDAYLTEGATPAQYAANPTLGLTGDSIPNVPKFQGYLSFSYQRPIANGWEGLAEADATYRGSVNSYFASNSFNIPLDSYTLVGLRAGLIKGPWSITAFARNLNNERAQVSAINTTQDPHALLTVQPRTIGITATRKF